MLALTDSFKDGGALLGYFVSFVTAFGFTYKAFTHSVERIVKENVIPFQNSIEKEIGELKQEVAVLETRITHLELVFQKGQ